MSEAPASRCRLIPPVAAEQLFALPPRAVQEIHVQLWELPRVDCNPCFVRMTYENDPDRNLDHTGVEPTVAERVRQSSACRVESNAIRIDISPLRPEGS